MSLNLLTYLYNPTGFDISNMFRKIFFCTVCHSCYRYHDLWYVRSLLTFYLLLFDWYSISSVTSGTNFVTNIDVLICRRSCILEFGLSWFSLLLQHIYYSRYHISWRTVSRCGTCTSLFWVGYKYRVSMYLFQNGTITDGASLIETAVPRTKLILCEPVIRSRSERLHSSWKYRRILKPSWSLYIFIFLSWLLRPNLNIHRRIWL